MAEDLPPTHDGKIPGDILFFACIDSPGREVPRDAYRDGWAG
jgi:hypothetical protein